MIGLPVKPYFGLSWEGFEKGAAVELARRRAWSVNTTITNRSAGMNIARDLFHSPLIDVEAATGAGYYYAIERWLPNIGFNLRF